MFSVWLRLNEGEMSIGYDAIEDCLADESLRRLFDEGHAIEVRIVQSGRRIAALPQALVSWERFTDSLVSNATTLLRS